MMTILFITLTVEKIKLTFPGVTAMPEPYLTHPYCFSEASMFLTTNYLCPCSHPSLFLPPSNFLCPPLYSLSVSHQMSAHQLCSDGWEEQTGWVFMEQACTQTATRACAHIHAKSVTDWPAAAGCQDFCPRVWRSPCVFPHLFTVYDHINMKQMPQTHIWLQTNMGHGQRRSGIWLFLC